MSDQKKVSGNKSTPAIVEKSGKKTTFKCGKNATKIKGSKPAEKGGE